MFGALVVVVVAVVVAAVVVVVFIKDALTEITFIGSVAI